MRQTLNETQLDALITVVEDLIDAKINLRFAEHDNEVRVTHARGNLRDELRELFGVPL